MENNMAQVSKQLADVSERTRYADGRVLNMHVAIFVTVVAIVVGFAAPICANDRPSDPFGNYTVQMNEEAYLFGVSLRDQVLLDRAHFHALNLTTNPTTPIARQYPRS